MSAACARIHGIAQHAAADQHAAHAGLAQALDGLLGLDAVAAAEHRDAARARRRWRSGPSRTTRSSDCAAVRPCTAIAAAPASSTIRASVGALISSSFHPARIFTVTGIVTAFVIAAMTDCRVRGLAHQAAAGVVLRDLRHRAAHVDVHDVGAEPLDDLRGFGHLLGIAAEDLDRDRPLLLGVSAYSSVRSIPRTRPSELTISVTTSPQPPCRFTRRRNAVSVMPAMGATTKGDGRAIGPIFIVIVFVCVFVFVSHRSRSVHTFTCDRSQHSNLPRQIALTSAASTCTLTPCPIRSTDRISRACVPLRVRRPTTPLSGPCVTSTRVPVLIVGHGS